MRLKQLVYCSAAPDLSDEDLQAIFEACQRNNPQYDISGLLYYENGYFLQAIEGEQAAINKLYNIIINDPRSTDHTLLLYDEISERDFSDWAMGFVNNKNLMENMAFKYSTTGEFNPYEFSPESAVSFLRVLADYSFSVDNFIEFSKE